VLDSSAAISCNHIFNNYPDYRILVLDLLTYAGSVDNLPTDFQAANASGSIEFWYGDVRNASLVENLMRRTDIIVHFAAEDPRNPVDLRQLPFL